MTTDTVYMRGGRLTLPKTARQALGLGADETFEVSVEGDAVVLRPGVLLRREDAWAYTPEHRRLLTEAHADSREGRVHTLSEDQLAARGDRWAS